MDSENSNEYYTEELVGIVPDKVETPKCEYIWDVYVNRPTKDDLIIGDFYSKEDAIIYMLKTFPTECKSENPPYTLKRVSKFNVKVFTEFIKREIRYVKKIIRRLMELI